MFIISSLQVILQVKFVDPVQNQALRRVRAIVKQDAVTCRTRSDSMGIALFACDGLVEGKPATLSINDTRFEQYSNQFTVADNYIATINLTSKISFSATVKINNQTLDDMIVAIMLPGRRFPIFIGKTDSKGKVVIYFGKNSFIQPGMKALFTAQDMYYRLRPVSFTIPSKFEELNFTAEMRQIKGNITLVNVTFNVTDFYSGKLVSNEVYARTSTAINLTKVGDTYQFPYELKMRFGIFHVCIKAGGDYVETCQPRLIRRANNTYSVRIRPANPKPIACLARITDDFTNRSSMLAKVTVSSPGLFSFTARMGRNIIITQEMTKNQAGSAQLMVHESRRYSSVNYTANFVPQKSSIANFTIQRKPSPNPRKITIIVTDSSYRPVEKNVVVTILMGRNRTIGTAITNASGIAEYTNDKLRMTDRLMVAVLNNTIYKDARAPVMMRRNMARLTLKPKKDDELSLQFNIQTGMKCIEATVMVQTESRYTFTGRTKNCQVTFKSKESEKKLQLGKKYTYMVNTPGFKPIKATAMQTQLNEVISLVPDRVEKSVKSPVDIHGSPSG